MSPHDQSLILARYFALVNVPSSASWFPTTVAMATIPWGDGEQWKGEEVSQQEEEVDEDEDKDEVNLKRGCDRERERVNLRVG